MFPVFNCTERESCCFVSLFVVLFYVEFLHVGLSMRPPSKQRPTDGNPRPPSLWMKLPSARRFKMCAFGSGNIPGSCSGNFHLLTEVMEMLLVQEPPLESSQWSPNFDAH